MRKTTRELAEGYAATFDDVTLVRVARNGSYAIFEEPNEWGSAPTYRKMTRTTLASTEIVQTPYGPIAYSPIAVDNE